MAIRLGWLYAAASRSVACLTALFPPVPFDADLQFLLQVSPAVQPAYSRIHQTHRNSFLFRNLVEWP
jgi:hypothetical protein